MATTPSKTLAGLGKAAVILLASLLGACSESRRLERENKEWQAKIVEVAAKTNLIVAENTSLADSLAKARQRLNQFRSGQSKEKMKGELATLEGNISSESSRLDDFLKDIANYKMRHLEK